MHSAGCQQLTRCVGTAESEDQHSRFESSQEHRDGGCSSLVW